MPIALALIGVFMLSLQGRAAPSYQTDYENITYQAQATSAIEANWFGYASGNGIRSNVIVDDDYVWVGTGGGVVRWNQLDGAYKMYLPSDGLVNFSVDSIAKDTQGHLWFGTYIGVSEYDGRIWKTYGSSTLGFSSVWVSTVDAMGNIWFGGYMSGLTKFDGSNWIRYNSEDIGLRYVNVRALAADGSGNLWAGTQTGLHKFDGTTWMTYTQSNSNLPCNNVTALAVAPNDDLWVGCGWETNAAAKLSSETWKVYTSTAGIWSSPQAFAFDESGSVWTHSYDEVKRLDVTDAFTLVVSLSDFGAGGIEGMAFDDSGKLWIGTGHGVFVFDGTTTDALYTDQHLSSKNITNLTFDQTGNLWVGFENKGGVTQFDGNLWVTHCPLDGGVSQNCEGIHDVAVDSEGHVWAVGSRLAEFDGSDWVLHTTPSIPSGWTFGNLAIDGNDNLWLATIDTLYEFDGNSNWYTYTTANSGLPGYIADIAIEGTDTVWIASRSDSNFGVARFDGVTWDVFTTSHGLQSNTVRSINVDHDNNVWFAYGSYGAGVTRFDGVNWTTFTTTHGLRSNEVVHVNTAPDGTVWVGMEREFWSGGIARFDGISWHSFSHSYLVNESANALAFDAVGNVWIVNSQFGIRVFNEYGLINTELIPVSGGTISTINGRVSVAFPNNAFAETVIVTMTSKPQTATIGYVGLGPFFDLTAVISSTNQPAQLETGKTYTMTAQCDPSLLNGVAEDSIALYWWDGSTWVRELSTTNITDCIVTATPNHFSLWAILGTPVQEPKTVSITKTVMPGGQVNYGDMLTYTLVISGMPGTEVSIYDPLSKTTFIRFAQRPTGIEYVDHAITGTMMITPTNQMTVSFVMQVGVPGTVGIYVDVSNTACIYPVGQTISMCEWSNTVTNQAYRPYTIFLPLVVRNQ